MEEGFFRFSNLSHFPEIIHGISNRHFGDMRFGKTPAEVVVKNRQNFLKSLNIEIKDLIVPQLVHGVSIVRVGFDDRGKGSLAPSSAIASTDGLVTAEKGLFLMVTAADCLPILIYDPINRIVGVIHAGWRGILNQIAARTIDEFRKMSSEPSNLIVGLGPGICQKHFVVKKDVLNKFMAFYPSASLIRNSDGYVDLRKAVMIDLKQAGIPRENIEIANFCPSCDNGLFGSFRKEKDLAPASSAVIGLRE